MTLLARLVAVAVTVVDVVDLLVAVVVAVDLVVVAEAPHGECTFLSMLRAIGNVCFIYGQEDGFLLVFICNAVKNNYDVLWCLMILLTQLLAQQ